MLIKNSEKAIDQVIDEMIRVVKSSKNEIFNISEQARHEYDTLKKELEETKRLIIEYIEEGDRLEIDMRASRKRLAEVSKDFVRYTENDIHQAYKDTHQLQAQMTVYREKEADLRKKRDDIERRLVNLYDTINKAEGITSKISVVEQYLADDFFQVNELIETAKEKQAFGLKIIEAQEEERRRLSREIHDGPAQMLANILLRSEIIERVLHENSVKAAIDELQSVRKMIRSSLYEVRKIIYDLRPMALDDLGLIPTIRKYIANLIDFHQIDIDFVFLGEEKRLNDKYEVALFRLMQESVQNAIKHANPTLIQVKLQIQKKNIIMIIKDNGKGFDVNIKNENSFGLVGMKERVDMLGGELDISSKQNEGTTVIIRVPDAAE
ncbi:MULTISPECIES: sensor histidine kinase [Oceanobacillus]|uniref:Signal transduction histidine-protein kinase/phosphatase DegS n=1 Tax=Oceanobacillus indicireducens TaxID=1004261 RepID=A0A917XV04_9BACI|nr:sensor histidine kinase [Oceanobacillus indicireducens]GGN53606.1 signal transduction histidine-protein kinase/phosphatase DegS [Oceanobacillus indicireducens]